jgi:hypothetical protein
MSERAHGGIGNNSPQRAAEGNARDKGDDDAADGF